MVLWQAVGLSLLMLVEDSESGVSLLENYSCTFRLSLF